MLAQEYHGQLPHRRPGHHRLHGQYPEHRDAAYVRCEDVFLDAKHISTSNTTMRKASRPSDQCPSLHIQHCTTTPPQRRAHTNAQPVPAQHRSTHSNSVPPIHQCGNATTTSPILSIILHHDRDYSSSCCSWSVICYLCSHCSHSLVFVVVTLSFTR